MNESYDNELKKIEFYDRYHPEYLPYVGDNYDKTGVLLLGESNYIDETNPDLTADVLRLIDSSLWYTTASEKLPKDGCIDWCNNRYLIVEETFEKKKKGQRTSPAHNMYLNPAKAFIEVFPQVANTWDAFTYFASMNYFQKPATKTGKSISQKKEDEQFAAANLCHVVSVLKPETIIFLSKKAHWAFEAHKPAELNELYIGACAHPACAWWNRDNGKHGRERFKEIITKRVKIIL